MTYRQELAAAHARIAQLEADAVGHVRGETEPTAKKASVAPNAARGWWWPWPFFVFSAVVLTYAFRFGMTLPAALSVGELVPLERGNLALRDRRLDVHGDQEARSVERARHHRLSVRG